MYLSVNTATRNRSYVGDDTAQRLCDLMAEVASRQDKTAFEELFAHFAPRVKALMLKHNCGAELAEDLMQETMLTVWNKAGQFASWRGSVSAWVFTIARNRRIDRFRRQGTRHYVDIQDCDLVDDAPLGEETVVARERDRIVSEAAETLPDDQKTVIKMAFVDDLSQSEIAKQLNIPLGTVKSRTRLAFRRIRQELEDAL